MYVQNLSDFKDLLHYEQKISSWNGPVANDDTKL
jgi:hypothetical protein